MFRLPRDGKIINLFIFTFATLLLTGACVEFFNAAWGTGKQLGEFSFSWFFLFLEFILFCLALLFFLGFVLAKPTAQEKFLARFFALRKRLGFARWLIAVSALVFPVYFLQYTAGGVIFQGIYMRSLLWAFAALIFASLISTGSVLIGWKQCLVALLLTSSEFVIAVEFIYVTNYPFSLGWSEGNRLWDYSILFGSDRYIYPANKTIPVFLDYGRQLIGGLPFLIPGISIGVERFWVALTFILPYLLLGLAAFRASVKEKRVWLLATLWVFLFLKQGPIHSPLVLGAALVVLVWGAPLWLAIPLVAGTGYFVQLSRASWFFAPAVWIIMLEFAGAPFTASKRDRGIWTRAIILGVVGIFGAVIYPLFIEPPARALFQSITAPVVTAAPVTPGVPAASGTPAAPVTPGATAAPAAVPVARSAIQTLLNAVLQSSQPLLWYRLLPNSTYEPGILVALIIAVSPLIIVLLYFLKQGGWKLTFLQKLSLLLPSLVFLLIGLAASSKIGGGSDLHNMDMFLITLVFIAVLAWYNGGQEWIQDSRVVPAALKLVIALLLILPAFYFLIEMYPHNLGEQAPRLLRLADAPNEEALAMLPTQKTVDASLAQIRSEIALAKGKGDVLFMDQRQLLTFGYIQDVPLVVEYEKKVLMNEALSSNKTYFAQFYRDLAKHRFALIISSTLRGSLQGSVAEFGEENDAWVKYVAKPILCYYESKVRLTDVHAQLLVPRSQPQDCSNLLP